MYQHYSAGVFCLDSNGLGRGIKFIELDWEHRALELVNDLDEGNDTASPIR